MSESSQRSWRARVGGAGLWPVVAVAALAFVAAGSWSRHLLEMRASRHLDIAAPLENAPPPIVFTTVVLGGFRGILTDILWLRASHLQEQGRFLETLQLADWITHLEPRNTDIWAFQSWNMAFNVTAMMPETGDRWRWVKNGMELLRNEGLRYNPSVPDLYCELAWLYQFKLGGISDSASEVYREEWMKEMQPLLAEDGRLPEVLSDEARQILGERGLVTATMREMDARYGGLDWRLPEAHALYWGRRGREFADDRYRLVCDRIEFQCLSALFMAGKLTARPGQGGYERSADLDKFGAVRRAYEAALVSHPGDDSVVTSYVNYLLAAAWVFDRMQRMEEAMAIHRDVQTRFPDRQTPSYGEVIEQISAQRRRRLPAELSPPAAEP